MNATFCPICYRPECPYCAECHKPEWKHLPGREQSGHTFWITQTR